MQEAWDKNAYQRHMQILEGRDISFSKLIVPQILGLLQSLDGYTSFSVLDIGCGTGVLAHILAKYVSRVVGIDSSANSIQIAREYTKEDENAVVECVGIENYVVSHSDKFDLAVANMTLQTVESLELALKKISNSLKEKGVLIFSIPHPCFWTRIRQDISESEYAYTTPSSHLIPFTISKDPDPLPCPVPYFHRPLEVYSSALYEAGFVIERIREPFPSQELAREYPKPRKYPAFLVLACRKQSSTEV